MKITARRRRAIDWLCKRYAREAKCLEMVIGFRRRLHTYTDADLLSMIRFVRRQNRNFSQLLTGAWSSLEKHD